MIVEKGKFSSQPAPNAKGVHKMSIIKVKVVMTLQKGKKVDNKVEMTVIKTTQEYEDLSTKEKRDNSPREYIPKAHFP